jgi:UDPglucose 6-dehydrogenase
MKVGVIGLGFVGLSLAVFLASKKQQTVGIDIDSLKIEKILKNQLPFYEPGLKKILDKVLNKNLKISNKFEDIKDCDFIFLTVGTPLNKKNEIDTKMVSNAAKEIGKNLKNTNKNPIIVIKSTVIPGTLQNVILPIIEKNSNKKNGLDFGIISNPEFLQESTAIENTKNPHLVVIGTDQSKFFPKAKNFLRFLHPKVEIIVTNFQTAEMIKYANNSFLATKISFINQLSNMCQKIPELNIDKVAKAIGVDPRIGKLFLKAGPGFGGSCLPKDLGALIAFSNNLGVNPTLLTAVRNINNQQVLQIYKIIKIKLGKIQNKKITIMGLAFKPNTDDIRYSVSIKLIKLILKNSGNVIVFDPKAMNNTFKIFKNKIKYADNYHSALKNSQCVVFMTDWDIFHTIKENDFSQMENKLVIDCRRIFQEKNYNLDYIALGIGKK